MKTSEDIMQVLSGLNGQDREWILKRLSPGARSALTGDRPANPAATANAPAHNAVPHEVPQASKPAAATTSSASAVDLHERLASADARAIAAVLSHEPAWVTHAVMQRDWPWQNDVTRMLASSIRNEVERLDASGVRYSRKVTELLFARLASSVSEPPVVDERSAFDKLVSVLGSKLSRKRLGMRA